MFLWILNDWFDWGDVCVELARVQLILRHSLFIDSVRQIEYFLSSSADSDCFRLSISRCVCSFLLCSVLRLWRAPSSRLSFPISFEAEASWVFWRSDRAWVILSTFIMDWLSSRCFDSNKLRTEVNSADNRAVLCGCSIRYCFRRFS